MVVPTEKLQPEISRAQAPTSAPGIPGSPAFTVEVRDESEGLEAYVCIHSIGEWGSSGGMRCVEDVTREEVELLARAMTFKFSFFGIPQGGAKAGLRLPYDAAPAERVRLIRAAARHLEPLLKRSNLWSVWTDMNFYLDDLRLFLASIGLSAPAPADATSFSSTVRTAVMGFWSIEACARHFALSRGASVAIEGYGGVGEQLAKLLVGSGFKVSAVSNHLGAVANPAGLDLALLAEAKRRYGSSWVLSKGPWETLSREELFTTGVDILVPGARVHSIDRDLATRLQARLIAPVANVPCTPGALDQLDARGIHYIPDFVVGGGGVCGWIQSVDDDYGSEYKDMIVRLLRKADGMGVPPRRLCEDVAHQGFEAIQANAYASSTLSRRLLVRARRVIPLNAWLDSSSRDATARARAQRLRLLFS